LGRSRRVLVSSVSLFISFPSLLSSFRRSIQVPMEPLHSPYVLRSLNDLSGQHARHPVHLLRSISFVSTLPLLLQRVALAQPSFLPPTDQALPSLAFLSLATLSSFYPLLLLPLLILLILQPSQPISTSTSPGASSPLLHSKTKATRLVGTFAFMLGSLLVGAKAMLGGWEGVFKGWRVILGIVDLTPNVGLSWYFFTEMFDHFRPFFTMVFQVSLSRCFSLRATEVLTTEGESRI